MIDVNNIIELISLGIAFGFSIGFIAWLLGFGVYSIIKIFNLTS